MAIYDLEIQPVSELTSNGMKKLSDIFYGTTDLIDNVAWDMTFTLEKSFYRTPFQLTKRFKGLKNVTSSSFISHVASSNGFEIYKILLKRGSTIPFWTAGIASFFRMKVRISNNNFRELATWDELFQRYYQPIGSYANSSDIDVTTNKISNGTSDIAKEFLLVTSIPTVTFTDVIPASASQYSIFISNVNGIPGSLYCSRYNSKVIFISEITSYGDFNTFDKSTIQNGTVFYDTVLNKVFIKENNYFCDYQHKLTFLSSTDDYKYLIENNTIYISNFNRLIGDEFIGTVNPRIANTVNGITTYASRKQFLVVAEYPFELNSITIVKDNNVEANINEVKYSTVRNVIKIENKCDSVLSVFVSYNILPIISFNRSIWPAAKDVKHFLADFSPNITSFTNGVICLFGKESDMSLRPASLSLTSNKTILEALSNVRCTATLRNADGVPLSGQNVTLSIMDDVFGLAKWTGDPDDNFQAKTNMAGEINGTIVNSQLKFGWCLQKEWAGDVLLSPNKKRIMYDVKGNPLRDPATRNKLYVPFETGISASNKVFIYMVTADDPIMGAVAAYWSEQRGEYISDKTFTGQKASEFYGRSGQLNSYEISAKKVAYVSLLAGVASNNIVTVETRFIKPKSITVINDKELIVRNSIIYSRELVNGSRIGAKNLEMKYQSSTEVNDFELILDNGEVTKYINPRFGWDNNWLLSDQEDMVSYLRVKPKHCSCIEFDTEVPGIDDPNVIGYFVIGDLGGKIEVQASHTDDMTSEIIYSNRMQIDLESYIKSESAFTLAQNKPVGFNVNNFLGSFGYLTISDYIKSPFGINGCSMICRWSDGGKKCTKPMENGISYRDTYYITDDSVFNMWCLHSHSYDATIPLEQVCPGLELRLVNPFLLFADKEEVHI